MRSRFLIPGAALTLLGSSLLLVGVGSTGANAAQTAVLVQNNSYNDNNGAPSSTDIAVGDTVKWFWTGEPHSVTSDTGLFDSHPTCTAAGANCGSITTGSQFTSPVFSSVGTFPYHCRVHATMTGVINVAAASPTPSPTPSSSASSSASASPSASSSSSASASASATPDTTSAGITLGTSHAEITAGNTPTPSGFVTNAAGGGLSGKTVNLIAAVYGGDPNGAAAGTATTDATGRFSFLVQPMTQTKYFARTGALTSPGVLVRVHRRINVTSPVPNSTVQNPVTFNGNLLPAIQNLAIGLAYIDGSGYHYLAQTKSDATGNFSLPATLPLGTHKFVVYTSASQGTLYGSKSLTLIVT